MFINIEIICEQIIFEKKNRKLNKFNIKINRYCCYNRNMFLIIMLVLNNVPHKLFLYSAKEVFENDIDIYYYRRTF